MNIDLSIVVHKGSGGNTGEKVLNQLIEVCNKKEIKYDIHVSEYRGHTIKLVQNIANNIRKNERLIIIGGDGTLNEAVNALKQIKSNVPIAYIPGGTGNDFARELKITKNMDFYIDSLNSLSSPNTLEIIKCRNLKNNTEIYSINSIGFGIDALIIYLASSGDKKNLFKKIGLGKLSYFVYLFEAIKKHKKFDIEIIKSDGNILNYSNALISIITNHPFFGGGIKIDPLSSSNNHELGLVIANNIKITDLIKIVYRIITHGDHFEKYDKIFRISDNEISIKINQNQYMQIDGEKSEPQIHELHFSISTHPFWICRK
ncbi:diacylglycerol/lipid kinase family protein [Peptostreptococcus canis]|uniref:YegS/Rv2252/BmrU family lipid kinase n=1 Tax=Peptostreptococcus canis TaxID=1159213 RepID=A0ABR6TIF3_9FIRM|nr:YegS/Rv2252/BmrU family lipid kinase [Peptostreptococcus canis]MBC2575172.1 YegS/Rv2252/BmrU family lipid kinase [Peptostreptococcus canis]MBP1997653.1 YegS/Rv2252/BmrU family lipid kinase [Peptostreptococcus canis]